MPWGWLWDGDLETNAVARVELDLIVEADRCLPPPEHLLHGLLIATRAPERDTHAALVGAYVPVRAVAVACLERAVGDLVPVDMVQVILRLIMDILRRLRWSRDRVKSRCNPLVGRRGIELELLENV